MRYYARIRPYAEARGCMNLRAPDVSLQGDSMSLFSSDDKRVNAALNYIEDLPLVHADQIAQIREDAKKYVTKELNDALDMPGGEKTKSWRDAVRAYVLLQIIYESKGYSPKSYGKADKIFAKSLDELMLKQRIHEYVDTKLAHRQGEAGKFYYVDSADGTNVKASVLHPFPAPGRKLWIDRHGAWKHAPFKIGGIDLIHTADYAADPKLNGIYSTMAANCVIVAFLYGGYSGGLFKSAKMVHLSGGGVDGCDWTQLNRMPAGAGGLGYEQPYAVLINTRDERSGSYAGASASAIEAKVNELGIGRGCRILIHYAKGGGAPNFGVDKWGYFGSTSP
jgi:hypothetical protein